jgi:hypothetical protein
MPKMIRAQTKTKAPIQLPITVLTGIELETAPVCVGEEEGVVVATTVKIGAVGEKFVESPGSIAKPVVATGVLLATDIPEMPEPKGVDEGSILFARYRPSLSNMMNVWQKERLEGG